MEKKRKLLLLVGVGLLAVFVIWTVLVRIVDVRAIGPQGSSVGFATVNQYIHSYHLYMGRSLVPPIKHLKHLL